MERIFTSMVARIHGKFLPEIIVLLFIAMTFGRAQALPGGISAQSGSRGQAAAFHDSTQKKNGGNEKKPASSEKKTSRKNAVVPLKGIALADTGTILAKIGDKTIFVDEFIRRAEYTIRPPYCKGDGGLEKKIVLNSLLAEKMLALEAGKDNKLAKSEVFQRMLQGRKEQLMREVLYYAEGTAKVKLDTGAMKKEFKAAGRTYSIEYFNVPNDSIAETVKQVLDTSASSFTGIYRALSGLDSLPPRRDVNWDSREDQTVRHVLFKGHPKVNQIFGPLRVNEESNLFIRVEGWTDHVAFTEKQSADRLSDVKEEMSRSQADERYDKYIARLMNGKTLQLDPTTFRKFVEIIAPRYLESVKEKDQALSKDLLTQNFWDDKKEQDVERNLHTLRNQTLFTIDNKTWTMEDMSNEMQRHPLVFRTRNLTPKNIAKQVKLAIADMLRDRYLADEAYKRGYDTFPNVVHYTEMWEDAIFGLWQKAAYLDSIGVTDDGKMEVVTKYLNPYVDSLRHKYSDRIEVNVVPFNDIKLTRIDMIALQNKVPFAVLVPAFPQLTNYKWLDYGKVMNPEKEGIQHK
jgi:hypothetical protein